MSKTKRKRTHGKTTFQDSWLSEERFKIWLKKSKDKDKAICRLCNSAVINIAMMRVSALTSHAKGSKHQEKLKAYNPISNMFFNTNNTNNSTVIEASSPTASSSVNSIDSTTASSPSFSANSAASSTESSKVSSAASQNRIDTMMNAVSVTCAEIRWVMKILMSHSSFRFCLDLAPLFVEMFPDSQIAKSFKLSKTKCSILPVFGLAPYFKELLIQNIKNSLTYSILFDESLNHHLQEEQMDLQVRYWDEKNVQAQTRYFDSRFFLRPNADNIVEQLLEALKPLIANSMLMLSMDGPNTNWAVLEKLKAFRSKNEMPQVMEVGSCGLHIVHGAFQTGVKATSWQLEKILKAMWKLFNDSPARRDLYIQLNQSEVFLLMFCQTRWVEDGPVACRARIVWKSVVKVIEHFQSLAKSKQPKNNKSYDTLVKHHNDSLMITKFHFFSDIASILSLYLKQFQTDAPMMPFVSLALEDIIRLLMKMILRSSVVTEADTAYNLIKIDVSKKENQLPNDSIKLPTATKSSLSSASASHTKKLQFKADCAIMIKELVLKLQERCPLKYIFVRSLKCLIPKFVVENKEHAIEMFSKVTEVIR